MHALRVLGLLHMLIVAYASRSSGITKKFIAVSSALFLMW